METELIRVIQAMVDKTNKKELTPEEQMEVLREAEEYSRRQRVQTEFVMGIEAGDILVNFNGHCGRSTKPERVASKYWLDNIIEGMRWVTLYGNKGPYIATEEAPLKLGNSWADCPECGKRFDFEFNGKLVYVVTRDENDLTNVCEEAGGIKEYKSKINLKVPSGKIIFANDIRYLVPDADKNRYVNYNYEIRATSWDYEEYGMIHGFTGNSCPSIFLDGDTIYVGNSCADYDDKYFKGGDPIPGRRVGSVCTDLWWFCAMDYDMVVDLVDKQKANIDDILNYADVVKVEPGEYEVLYNLPQNNLGSTELYATFKKVQV